jgi:phospholipid transport system substrate-binding protein
MYKKIPLTMIIFITFIFTSIFTYASVSNTPKASIEATVNAILDTLRDKSLSAPVNKEKRRNKIRELIRSRFDFEEMAKRTLARHWRDRTHDERKEFVSIFSDLLESSYITKIEAYTNEKITFDKETLSDDGRTGVVKTTIITANANIPIDYKVIQKNNDWFVYDVVIEGVSFISTYRSQYDKIITSQSYAQLVQIMKDKLAEQTKKLSEKK